MFSGEANIMVCQNGIYRIFPRASLLDLVLMLPCTDQERIKERERVTYASATVQAESKTTTIKRTILEIAHCCMCMECSPT